MVRMGSCPHNGNEILGMPRLKPMLIGTALEVFDEPGWLFEMKWDGYRCLSYIREGSVYLDSRNQKPLLPRFPSLKNIHAGIKAKSVLLDGEIVAFREGRVDFSYLRKQPAQVNLVVFDILYLNDRSLLVVPLKDRKDVLSQVVIKEGPVFISQVVEEKGTALLDIVKSRGMEGIIAKKSNSKYRPGKRSKEWLKIKNVKESVFWVVGYLPSPGRRIASLVIATKVGDDDSICVVGSVSSGIGRDWELKLLELLGEPLKQPFPRVYLGKSSNLASKAGKIKWVRPYFGIVVRYTDITSAGGLRHPVFIELKNGN